MITGYYSFGLKHKGYNNTIVGADHPYGFNGKEEQDELGLAWHDFGARNYDAAIGRWMNIDPLAEEMPSWSPYNYTFNSPVCFTDPTGMAPEGDYYDRMGNHLGNDGKKDDKVYVVDGTSKFNIDDYSEGGKYHNNQIGFNEDNGAGYSVNELNISHSKFLNIAATVGHEGDSSPDESLWIAHSANNYANDSNKDLHSLLMSGYSSAPNSVKNSGHSSSTARAAVIDVLSGKADPTGGASLWDGTDFLAWGLNSPYGNAHAKFRQYKSIDISGSILSQYKSANLSKYKSGTVGYGGVRYSIPASVFTNSSNLNSSGGFNFNTGRNRTHGLVATGTRGHTIFWKKIK